MRLPNISYSSWQLWRNGCQKKWELDCLKKVRLGKNYGIHMDFGTAVHWAIELSRSRSPKVTKTEAIVRFERAFRLLYTWHYNLYRQKDRDSLAREGSGKEYFLEAGRTILSRFDECKDLAEAEVLYNEYKIEQPIDRTDDVQVDFKGYVDMVVKTTDKRKNTILYVCDFKSCSWGWPLEKKQDKELHFQILLYKHFICKKFGLDPKNVRTAFVLLKKRPRKGDSPVEFFPISAGPVSVQRAIDAINEDITGMAEAVVANSFEKNTKFCVNDFGDRCPYNETEHCDAPKRA